jgi:hypothetical protein
MKVSAMKMKPLGFRGGGRYEKNRRFPPGHHHSLPRISGGGFEGAMSWLETGHSWRLKPLLAS